MIVRAAGSGQRAATAPSSRSESGVDSLVTGSRRVYLTLIYGLGALMCLPFWLVSAPPLVDYPNHLARTYVLYHYQTVAAYQRYYDLVPQVLPNLAFDLIVPALLPLVSIGVAGKLFMTATVLLFVAGCDLLGRAIHGRPTWLALPCLLFCYHAMLLFGFLNYSFGLGLFFVTFAIWLGYRATGGRVALAAVVVLAVACYAAHLSALVFLALGMAVVTAADWASGRRSLRQCVVGLLPLALPLVIVPLYAVRIGQTRNVYWGTFTGKLSDVIGMMATYSYRLDHAVALGLGVLLCVVLVSARGWRLERPVLVLAAVFGVLFLLCPEGVFETWKADWRFIPPAAVFTCLAWQLRIDARLARVCVAGVCVILATRVAVVGYDWVALDRQIAAQVRLFDRMAMEARVYPLVTYPGPADRRPMGQRAFWHIIQYGTITRHAKTPSLFAIRGQQILAYKAPERYRILASDATPRDVDWSAVFGGYDYVWAYDLSPELQGYLRARCDFVSAEAKGVLWRVRANSPPPDSGQTTVGPLPGAGVPGRRLHPQTLDTTRLVRVALSVPQK